MGFINIARVGSDRLEFSVRVFKPVFMHQPNLLGTSCVFASVSVFLSDPVIPGVRSLGLDVSE